MIMIFCTYRFIFIGYIKLILAMSWYQLIYDMTLFNSAIDVGNYPILYISYLGQFIGGIGSSIMSNWISFILFYVVIFEKSFDIMRNYSFILLSSVIVSIPTVIVYSIGALPEGANTFYVDIAGLYLYFYARVITIALNFIMIGCIVYKNYRVRSKSTTKTPAEIAINTLCRRIMYYPILQTISRSGYAWYESQYGFDFSVTEAEHNQSRYAALMFTAIITPTVSVGYLILFLTIEPNAYDCFKELFCCGSSSSSKRQHNKSQNDSLRASSNFEGTTTTTTTNNTTDPSNMCELNSSGIRESIDSDNNRQTDYRYQSESSMYRHSWNVFRSSIADFFIPADEKDFDNRTEDEIFAIINENQLLNTVKIPLSSSIIELNDRRIVIRRTSSITITNPLRSSNKNNNNNNNNNDNNDGDDDVAFNNL